ncbi:hypothetical protein [Curtobacterium sp. MCSS17_016]|uniref:hypothetical protein n=1 Tax=Curtobacterium sp. MCSS17_016 TaxID=2175644 RepID=UPI0011B7C37D|nr:hypothetical protein [Curtobacterium sp. MCSS17_016]WIE80999.1 hypothetical protein DEJ19_021015 [Curtobacterium sp. MCSS17_016]
MSMRDDAGRLRNDDGRFARDLRPGYDGVPLRQPLTAHFFAESKTDDAAYIALDDLSSVLAGHPEARIIGGHMVSLITTAYPTPGLTPRRTGDADAGIPVELASSGALHDALLDLGYDAESGNRYVRPTGTKDDPAPTIDLLTESLTGRFGDQKFGGRAFNIMPGMHLATSSGITVNVNATLTDDSALRSTVTVPTVEAAVVLKSYAWQDRPGIHKDAADLHNLFQVLDHHGADAVGGWQLNQPGNIGARRDAAANLHLLADRLETRRSRPDDGFDRRALTALIRQYVVAPE